MGKFCFIFQKNVFFLGRVASDGSGLPGSLKNATADVLMHCLGVGNIMTPVHCLGVLQIIYSREKCVITRCFFGCFHASLVSQLPL